MPDIATFHRSLNRISANDAAEKAMQAYYKQAERKVALDRLNATASRALDAIREQIDALADAVKADAADRRLAWASSDDLVSDLVFDSKREIENEISKLDEEIERGERP